MSEAVVHRTIKKAFLRLMSVLFVSYVLAYIDRINVGFAAIRMNTDIAIVILYLTYWLPEVAIAALGIYGAKLPFWPLPSVFLAGDAAAAGIALTNSIGNPGGFVGRYAVRRIQGTTHS
jgi:hypothetical protein